MMKWVTASVLLLAAGASGLTEFHQPVTIEGAFMRFVQGYQEPVAHKLGDKCVAAEAHKGCGGFACVNSTCVKCVTDEQCAVESAVYACNRGAGDCVLRPLDMANLTHDEIVAGILAFFITALAAVAGIGGGGMLVPLYILAAGFPPPLAVSMSQATILGCSGLNVLFMMVRRHPTAPKPLVDYNAVLILIPMTLSGTMIGHMLGRVMPDWLRLVLLVLLLGYMLKRTLAKASKAAAQAAAKQHGSGTEAESQALLQKQAHASATSPSGDVESQNRGSAKLASIIATRYTQYPLEKFAYCIFIWILLVLMSYAKHTYVKCGTGGYWGVTACIVGSMVLMTAYAGSVLKSRDEEAQAAGYVMAEDEVEWNSYTTMYYPLMSITAGIGAALLGIGGGMILGIILFEMSHHIKPEVSAATASVATALVASKASMEFYFYGELPLDYCLYFVLIGCLGTIMGQGPIGAFIKYKNKSYWIVYALALIIAGSLVALAVAGALNVYKTWVSGGSMGLGSLCEKTE